METRLFVGLALIVSILVAPGGTPVALASACGPDPDMFVDSGYQYGYSVDRTVLGDLDGDGDLDFVTGNTLVAGSWFRNSGDGTFSGGGAIGPGEGGSKYVSLADFNGDTTLDLVTCGYGGSIQVRLNDGTGVFAAPIVLPPPLETMRGVDTGDFDDDGDTDIIVIATWGGVLFLNDGSASFTSTAQPLFSSSQNGSVAVADIDGDGDLDVSVLNAILLNDGSGAFTDSGQSLLSYQSWERRFGDFDGDSDLDLIVADRIGPTTMFLNDGNGVFTDSMQWFGSSYQAPAIADIDLDGDIDLALQGWEETGIYLNAGSGVFELVQTLPAWTSYTATFGDLDGDLYPELVQARVFYGARVFRNQLPFPLCAAVDLDPNTLNLGAKGRWVTGYIELPDGYPVADIDVSTVELDDTISAELHPAKVGDHDGDSVPDLMVKFDRRALTTYLAGTTGDVTLTVGGELTDGHPFGGACTITVIDPPKR